MARIPATFYIFRRLADVTFTSIEIYRVSGDKLAEEWVELDMLGLLQQLGVIPPSGNSTA
jgi:hypothetical protein